MSAERKTPMFLNIKIHGDYSDNAVVFPALMPLVMVLAPELGKSLIEELGPAFVDRACEPGGMEYPTSTDINLLTSGVDTCISILTEMKRGPQFDCLIFEDREGTEITRIQA